MFRSAICCCWILVGVAEAAGRPTCYPPGGVAGIVVATIIVTCVVGGLIALAALKYWWAPRHRNEKVKTVTESEKPDHQLQRPPQQKTDFAFDNPYFRNQEAADETDGAEKGKNKSTTINKNSLRSSKLSEKTKKARSGRNHFVFGGKKQKALDDSCIAAVEAERTFVSLKGHDFTGLGFNICGNMRDGILVKDVLHRGPASESGLIKAGDKIISVTVSFSNMVYEDALTILSYASPYDVQLEIERIPDKARATPSGSKKLGSCSFNNSGQKLFHPLYRSQSIDDLTQIDKDTLTSHSGGPRRSQSVGVAAHKLAFKNADPSSKVEERGPVPLTLLSTTGSLNEKMLANVMTDGSSYKGLQWEKRFEDTLDTSPESTTPSCSNDGASDSGQPLDVSKNRRNLEITGDDADNSRTSGTEDDDKKSWQRRQNALDPEVSKESKKRVDAGVGLHLVSTPSRSRLTRREEENDSDVSRDSLELSHRGYQKSKKNATLSVYAGDRGNSFLDSYKPQYPQKKRNASPLKNLDHVTEQQSKGRTERMYVSDRTNTCARMSNTLLSTSEEMKGKDRSSYAHSKLDATGDNDSVAYEHSREIPENQSAYRTFQRVSGAGERQQLRNPESLSPNYGCNDVNKVNGGGSVYKTAYNSASHCSQPTERDNVRITTSSESKSSPQQTFFKRTSPTPAGGMFTQINPFQLPSKQKTSNFKPRVYREDVNKHSATVSSRQSYSTTHPDSVIKHSSPDYVRSLGDTNNYK